MLKVPIAGLPALAHNVLARLSARRQGSTVRGRAAVVALRGELGAGKTTFVQALARELGVTEAVQSPTYVLMKKYPVDCHGYAVLVHIDAYRLDDPKEFLALRPQEFLGDPKTLVVVEWPERVGTLLPAPDVTINFSSQDAGAGERYISME